ncbi:MAG TPA: CBS domain-containing protein [Rhodospirillales bacterium]|jgi:CBS domain-containing protein|nr:CBS domain-containing protein [Rhodospirillales bacterium]MEE3051676.1 CBS domain-containing protein [Pseudomonadota bacterium]HIM42329.1 CBS domain-containing protein [Rhodospirillales bacterium]HIN22092.1 CBS domain-containing protein [Rhodospirillales bacterium]|tara:strand:- start:440 stop:868 length:429 start_codon:yes stop_codon:yes gene_type:complete
MTTLKMLLKGKGHDVWSVHPDDTVLDAIKMLAEKDIGALIVIKDDKPVGIFTERDYARNVYLKGKSSLDTAVRDVMVAPVICVKPDQTVDECMALMTAKRFRHLPIMDGDELVGMVSIGDLVKSVIAEQQFTIEQMEQYIHS